MSDTVIIDPQFRGPPDAANGGYAAGLLAGRLGGPAEVTLRRPVPIGRPLRFDRADDGTLRLLDGDESVSTASRSTLQLDRPPVPGRDIAAACSRHGGSGNGSTFSNCFVCGRGNPPERGLRVHAAPLPDGSGAAAWWTPHAHFFRGAAQLPEEFLWAALDCPGAVGLSTICDELMVTGRMTGEILGGVGFGESCIVHGWPVAREGRKLLAGTAIYGADGNLKAQALSVWITIGR